MRNHLPGMPGVLGEPLGERPVRTPFITPTDDSDSLIYVLVLSQLSETQRLQN